MQQLLGSNIYGTVYRLESIETEQYLCYHATYRPPASLDFDSRTIWTRTIPYLEDRRPGHHDYAPRIVHPRLSS